MKYYLVCFIDHTKDDTIIVKDSYQTKEDAINSLERAALEYVKEFQGKQQADRCKTEKTPEQILYDTTLKEGMYIRKLEEKVYLYEKVNVVIPSRLLWNSYELKVNKIGLFNISEYNFDDSIFRCGCMLERAKTKSTVIKSPEKQFSFLNELAGLMGTDDKSSITDNWRNIKKQKYKIKKKPIEEQNSLPAIKPVKTQSTADIVDEIMTSISLSAVPPAPPAPPTSPQVSHLEPELAPIQPKLVKTMSLPIKLETTDKSQPEIININSTRDDVVIELY